MNFDFPGNYKNTTIIAGSRISNFIITTKYNDDRKNIIAGNPVLISGHADTMRKHIRKIEDSLHFIEVQCIKTQQLTLSDLPDLIKNQAHGFMGIIGGLYGDYIENTSKSRLHYEIEEAIKHWHREKKYVTIFIPKHTYYHELQEEAQRFFHDRFELEATIQADSKRNQQFIQSIITQCDQLNWLTLIRRYSSFVELYEAAQVAYANWYCTPTDLIDKTVEPGNLTDNLLSSETLGYLNVDLFEALESVLRQTQTRKHLALLIRGQEATCAFGPLKEALKQDGLALFRGRPLATAFSALPENCTYDHVLEVYRDMLNLQPDALNMQTLAAEIYTLLRQDSLNIGLDNIENYPGGVQAFYSEFWSPLVEAIQQLMQAMPVSPKHRFINLLLARTTASLSDTCLIPCADVQKIDDPKRLIQLPVLRDFEPQDIKRWHEQCYYDFADWMLDIDVEDLVQNALHITHKNSSRPQPDHVQRNVIHRLRQQDTWKSNKED